MRSAAIDGADKIRLIAVDAGEGRSRSSAVPTISWWGSRCRWLIQYGSAARFAIGKRKLKGVTSNGMLCSGKELGLTDDGAGLLVLGPEANAAAPGRRSPTAASGLEADTVFDITVEGNRPDAWCIAGVARDLAAPRPALHAGRSPSAGAPRAGWPSDGHGVVASPDCACASRGSGAAT